MRETSDRRSDGVAVEKPERAAAEHSDAATRVREILGPTIAARL